MPQIKSGKDGSSPIATQVKENKPFLARLRDRYKPTEFVRVINIDSVPFTWEYFPIDGEEVFFSDDGKMRQIEGRRHYDAKYENLLPGNDQLWMINPGEVEVLIGANADLFIMGLYKVVAARDNMAKKAELINGQPQTRKFNWNDGAKQEFYINKIFLGVANPEFEKYESSRAAASK